MSRTCTATAWNVGGTSGDGIDGYKIEIFLRTDLKDSHGWVKYRFERAGHDFWLTRIRHGAGFWDGDWPDESGTRLTDASHAYGSVDLYVGDDGKIYA